MTGKGARGGVRPSLSHCTAIIHIIALEDAVGQEVLATYVGEERTMSGPEFTGISSSTWVYAPLIVELANGKYLSCSPGDIVLLDAKPETGRAEQFRDERGRTPHKRRVADILVPADGEPEVLVLMEEGFVLSHYYLPGGSHYWFEQAARSEIDETYTSRITGRTATLRDFVQRNS